MYKVYIPHGSPNYANWVGPIVSDLSKADLVLFTGGTDINAKLYNEKPSPANDTPDENRDDFEVHVFLEAYHKGMPMMGICRGAQLLCVMAGGKLVQNQSNSCGRHHITPIINGEKQDDILVTSSHHQAQFPWPIKNFRLLGFTYGICSFHHDGEGKEMVKTSKANLPEVEDALYPQINALAIQSHPEWMYPPADKNEMKTIAHYKRLLKLFMEGKLW